MEEHHQSDKRQSGGADNQCGPQCHDRGRYDYGTQDQNGKRVVKTPRQVEQETQLQEVEENHQKVLGLVEALVFREHEDGNQVANDRNAYRQITKA